MTRPPFKRGDKVCWGPEGHETFGLVMEDEDPSFLSRSAVTTVVGVRVHPRMNIQYRSTADMRLVGPLLDQIWTDKPENYEGGKS